MSDAHLDDAQLSALIDGESADRTHLLGCGVCQRRLDLTRQAIAFVAADAADVVPDRESAEQAIEAALAAMPQRNADQAVPMRATRPQRMPPPAWIGAAAVVLILLALAPLLFRSNSPESTAALRGGGAADESDSLDGSAGAAGGSTSAFATADAMGTDYGNHSDTATLIARLRDVPAAAPQAALEAQTTEAAGGAERDAAAQRSAEDCTDEIAAEPEPPPPASLERTGTVTWQGIAALVYVYAVDEGRQLFVMRRGDCDLLATQRF